MMKFEYLLYLYVADDGPYSNEPFTTNTPVAIGHEIDWSWNKECPEEHMTLIVFDITHRDGKTILFCNYYDIYTDEYLVETLVKIGVCEAWAKAKPDAVQEWRNHQRKQP